MKDYSPNVLSDLARLTAERDAARNGENEAMALVIGLEGTVHRLTEDLRVARVDVGIVGLQSDGYRRERDAARAEAARLQARLDDYYDDHRAVVAGPCACGWSNALRQARTGGG